MANPIKGEALVQVEAGEFTLAMTLGACAAIEGQFEGRTLNEILGELDGDNPNITVMLTVIWAGLKKHHNLSFDAVGDLVSMGEIAIWGGAIGRAMAQAMPEKKGGAARPRKAKAG